MCSGPNLQLLHAPGHGDGRTVLSHVTLPVLLLLPLLLLQKTFGDGQHQTLPEDSRKTSNACAQEAAPAPPTLLPLSSAPPSFYSLVCPISVVTGRSGESYGLNGPLEPKDQIYCFSFMSFNKFWSFCHERHKKLLEVRQCLRQLNVKVS